VLPRSSLSIVLLFAVLPLLLLGSCTEDDDPVTGKRLNVKSEIQLDRDTIYVGEWVTFSLKFENNGDDPVELTFPDTCRAACEVVTPDGDVIFRPDVCSSEKLGLTLPTEAIVWLNMSVSTLRADMDDVIWPLDEDRLSPGVHQLRAGLLGHRYTIPWAKVTFTVEEWPAPLSN
jgi:hypothetical protein